MAERDFFISHATEDKAEIARSLATELSTRGFSVWYDEYSLTMGDHLRQEIDKGLQTCRYGIVILSPNFFAKQWPQYELDTLLDREIHERRKLILPIWHKIGDKDVARHSTKLAIRYAAHTSDGLATVVARIMKAVEDDVAEEKSIEDLAANVGAEGIRWEKVANLWWLSHDLVELFRWLLSGISKQWIDIGFQQSHHHAAELNFDEPITEKLQHLKKEAEDLQESDWTPQRREKFAAEVRVIFNVIAQINQEHQSRNAIGGFKSSPD